METIAQSRPLQSTEVAEPRSHYSMTSSGPLLTARDIVAGVFVVIMIWGPLVAGVVRVG